MIQDLSSFLVLNVILHSWFDGLLMEDIFLFLQILSSFRHDHKYQIVTLHTNVVHLYEAFLGIDENCKTDF